MNEWGSTVIKTMYCHNCNKSTPTTVEEFKNTMKKLIAISYTCNECGESNLVEEED